MSEETTQADAAALVAMTVADLAAHLDGVDLDTLNAALARNRLVRTARAPSRRWKRPFPATRKRRSRCGCG
jgi:hypothetical protein